MGNVCCTDETVDRAEAVEIQKKQNSTDERAAHHAPPAGAKRNHTTFQNTPKTDSGTEFRMQIDKTGGRRLGVDVDHQDGCTLLVDAVTGDLFQQWNDNHPDFCVKPGDRIIEVNGIREDVLQLVEECKQNKMLELVIRRGPCGP